MTISQKIICLVCMKYLPKDSSGKIQKVEIFLYIYFDEIYVIFICMSKKKIEGFSDNT